MTVIFLAQSLKELFQKTDTLKNENNLFIQYEKLTKNMPLFINYELFNKNKNVTNIFNEYKKMKKDSIAESHKNIKTQWVKLTNMVNKIYPEYNLQKFIDGENDDEYNYIHDENLKNNTTLAKLINEYKYDYSYKSIHDKNLENNTTLAKFMNKYDYSYKYIHDKNLENNTKLTRLINKHNDDDNNLEKNIRLEEFTDENDDKYHSISNKHDLEKNIISEKFMNENDFINHLAEKIITDSGLFKDIVSIKDIKFSGNLIKMSLENSFFKNIENIENIENIVNNNQNINFLANYKHNDLFITYNLIVSQFYDLFFMLHKDIRNFEIFSDHQRKINNEPLNMEEFRVEETESKDIGNFPDKKKGLKTNNEPFNFEYKAVEVKSCDGNEIQDSKKDFEETSNDEACVKARIEKIESLYFNKAARKAQAAAENAAYWAEKCWPEAIANEEAVLETEEYFATKEKHEDNIKKVIKTISVSIKKEEEANNQILFVTCQELEVKERDSNDEDAGAHNNIPYLGKDMVEYFLPETEL